MSTNKSAKQISVIFLLAIFGSIPPCGASTLATKPQDLAVSDDGAYLLVALAAAKQIQYVDIAVGQIVDSLSLPRSPSGITVAGQTLYVTTSSDSEPAGVLYVFNWVTKAFIGTVAVGHGAHAPRLSRDGRQLYVLNRWEATVSVIDTATLQQVAVVGVLREPSCCDATPDGRYLFVANFLPATRSDMNYVAADVSVIDLQTFTKIRDIKLPNGASAVTGIRVCGDGKYAYAIHNVGSFLMPTNQLIMGWQNFSMMSVIDVAQLCLATGIILDDAERGAANPAGICLSPDDKTIYVTHAGTHELSVIDQAAMRDKLAVLPDVSGDFTFLLGVRRRIRLDGNGPRKVVAYGNAAYVLEYFTETIDLVDRYTQTAEAAGTIVLTENLQRTSAEMGERYYCDATKCFQQWQSCTSCHPNGRGDGLNWDLANDGLGNDKNTKAFVYSHLLPPAMATGVRPNAAIAVRAGFKFIEFSVVPEEYCAKVDEYLKALSPVPSPYLVDGQLTQGAQRGEQLFYSRGCGTCHPPPYYSDQQLHTMGTLGPRDIGPLDGTWDTPTLIEVWRSAPYLHDGRCATLKEVFTVEQHGDVIGLSEQEIDALVEFILSL